jgi:hypothetical protein
VRSDEELIQQAQAWRERATAVLAASDLLRTLQEVGEVVFSGSYAYGLMMSPDIDIHLLPAVWSRDAAVSLVQGFLLQDWWNACKFGDWVREDFRAGLGGRMPRGYYVCLWGPHGGAYWKVDIWMLNPARYPGDVWAPRMAVVSDEERLAILRIKDATKAAGVPVYTAVLEAGVRTPEDFIEWRSKTLS